MSKRAVINKTKVTFEDVTPPTQAELEAIYQTTIPRVVSMRQARLYLHAAGLLDAITAKIALMDTSAHIEWEFAQEIRRDHPLISTIAAALGWTELQLDQMFIEASKS